MIAQIFMHRQYLASPCCLTEVQGISFVGYTGVGSGRPRLWNLQNLCPVPPYIYLGNVILIFYKISRVNLFQEIYNLDKYKRDNHVTEENLY